MNEQQLETVEYGSRFQKLNDVHSDVDEFVLYLQPLDDCVFKPTKTGRSEKNETKYFSLDAFLNLLEKGDYTSHLYLCALLSQAKNKKTKVVFEQFYQSHAFYDYVESHSKRLVTSLLGQLKQVEKRMLKKGATGKDLVNQLANLNRLAYVVTYLTKYLTRSEKEKYFNYQTFVEQSTYFETNVVSMNELLKYKRYNKDELKTVLNVEDLYTRYSKLYNSLEKMYQQHSCLQRKAESYALNDAKKETIRLLAMEWVECQLANS